MFEGLTWDLPGAHSCLVGAFRDTKWWVLCLLRASPDKMGAGHCSGCLFPCHPLIWNLSHLGSLKSSLLLNDWEYDLPRPGLSDTFSKIPCFHSFSLITLFDLKNTKKLIIDILSRKRTISLLFCQCLPLQTGFLYLLVVTALANYLLYWSALAVKQGSPKLGGSV